MVQHTAKRGEVIGQGPRQEVDAVQVRHALAARHVQQHAACILERVGFVKMHLDAPRADKTCWRKQQTPLTANAI